MIVTDLNFWREGFPKDKKLVVTNGCFDIIHAGHIHYLNEAKSFGDYLMVGINSDSGVRALKGNGRPGMSRVVVHEAIETKGLTLEDIEMLKNKVEQIIKKPLLEYYSFLK